MKVWLCNQNTKTTVSIKILILRRVEKRKIFVTTSRKWVGPLQSLNRFNLENWFYNIEIWSWSFSMYRIFTIGGFCWKSSIFTRTAGWSFLLLTMMEFQFTIDKKNRLTKCVFVHALIKLSLVKAKKADLQGTFRSKLILARLYFSLNLNYFSLETYVV